MNNIIERIWKQGGLVNIEDLRGTAFQAEESAHTFRIRGVDENGEPLTLTGTCAAIFLRADNTDVAITGTITDGAAEITLTDECYDMPGRFGLTIYVTSEEQTVAVYAAIGSVCRTSSGVVSPETGEDVMDLINAINDAIEDLEEAIAKIPQDYQDLEDDVAALQSDVEDIQEDVGDLQEKTNDYAPVIINDASGEIVSIADGAGDMKVKKLVVNIEPAQDLHGYDNPWPAGGGKNLLPMTVELIKAANASGGTWNGNTFTSNDGISYTLETNATGAITGIKVNGTASSDSSFVIADLYGVLTDNVSYTLNGCPNGGSSSKYSIYIFNSPSYTVDARDTGSGVTFTSNSDATNYKARIYIKNGQAVSNMMFYPMVRLSSVSDATFAPYSNICPISGWDSAEVTGTGKNLLKLFDTSATQRGITYSKENGIVKASGTYAQTTALNSAFSIAGTEVSTSNYANYIISSNTNTIPLKPGTYTASVTATKTTGASGIQAFMGIFRTLGGTLNNGDVISLTYGSIVGQTKTFTFTITENAYFYCGIAYGVATAETVVDFEIEAQLEVGDSASAFVPYNESTTEYEFPQAAGTVYGGSLTIHQDGSGELVVENGEVDLGTLNYTKSSAYFYADAPSDSAPVISNGQPFICEIYKRYVGALNSMPDFTAGLNNVAFSGIKVFYCKDSRFDNASDFKTAMSGVKLVYPLATPVTYQLTNQQVLTLLKGSNVCFANCGSISLEYPADTKLYIDGKVAELQALILENISNS